MLYVLPCYILYSVVKKKMKTIVLLVVLLAGVYTRGFGDVLNVAWDMDASGTSLTVTKGTKVYFNWIAVRDLYLLKKPCAFDGTQKLLAPESRAGSYLLDTGFLPVGTHYFGCSLDMQCDGGVSKKITVLNKKKRKGNKRRKSG